LPHLDWRRLSPMKTVTLGMQLCPSIELAGFCIARRAPLGNAPWGESVDVTGGRRRLAASWACWSLLAGATAEQDSKGSADGNRHAELCNRSADAVLQISPVCALR
jgi:hypothetical protein